MSDTEEKRGLFGHLSTWGGLAVTAVAGAATAIGVGALLAPVATPVTAAAVAGIGAAWAANATLSYFTGGRKKQKSEPVSTPRPVSRGNENENENSRARSREQEAPQVQQPVQQPLQVVREVDNPKLVQENQELRNRLLKSEQEKAALRAQINEMRQMLVAMQKELEALRAENAKLREEIAMYRAKENEKPVEREVEKPVETPVENITVQAPIYDAENDVRFSVQGELPKEEPLKPVEPEIVEQAPKGVETRQPIALLPDYDHDDKINEPTTKSEMTLEQLAELQDEPTPVQEEKKEEKKDYSPLIVPEFGNRETVAKWDENGKQTYRKPSHLDDIEVSTGFIAEDGVDHFEMVANAVEDKLPTAYEAAVIRVDGKLYEQGTNWATESKNVTVTVKSKEEQQKSDAKERA
ncbi:MAG: hypothetical protein J6U64_04150, partial [Alphaproteobacteria bacterium]|nr:hypothetical protein [Alphaproteobacteria bacterium]